MTGVKLMVLLCAALLTGCARAPARCERPLGVMPEAPRVDQDRRLVASIDDGGACHVRLHLPDDISALAWPAARDAALADAHIAARSCCAQPRASNAGAWPTGATVFDVAFDCASP